MNFFSLEDMAHLFGIENDDDEDDAQPQREARRRFWG